MDKYQSPLLKKGQEEDNDQGRWRTAGKRIFWTQSSSCAHRLHRLWLCTNLSVSSQFKFQLREETWPGNLTHVSRAIGRLVSSEKRRVSVLWECSPGELHLIAVEGHTSKNICAAQIDFDGVKNRTQSWWGRRSEKGCQRGWLQSEHIIQNSQINNKNITKDFISRYFKAWWSLVVYKLRSLSTNQSPFQMSLEKT